MLKRLVRTRRPANAKRPQRAGPAAAAAVLIGLWLAAAPLGAATEEIVFKDPLDNSPLDIPLPEGDERTEAVAQFHETGENLYNGDADALAEGKQLYARWCQACHMPDGSGRMGPSLIDDAWNYPRNDTDVGKFETIHAGATGAMQAFGNRLSQDEILRLVAYLNSLKQP